MIVVSVFSYRLFFDLFTVIAYFIKQMKTIILTLILNIHKYYVIIVSISAL